MAESEQPSPVKAAGPTFVNVIQSFVDEVISLKTSFGGILKSAGLNRNLHHIRLLSFLRRAGQRIEPEDGQNAPKGVATYKFGPESFLRLRRFDRALWRTDRVAALIPGSLLATLVSRFDAHMGSLLRLMITVRPEVIFASESSLSYKQLRDLGAYNTALEFLVSQEVESLLRKSHSKQFDWLEGKLNTTLKKLTAWPDFIELTERRNLIVHCDSVVSHQYISTCCDNNVQFRKALSTGDRLTIDERYFRNACDVICEVGTKLAYVIWRKLSGSDTADPDGCFNDICFMLLVEEEYELALRLLDFFVNEVKTYASERVRLVGLVNFAQAHKWCDREDECARLLDSQDWSACDADFQICVASLKGDVETAVGLMKKCGQGGPLKPEHYRDWPAFRGLRQEKTFQNAFEEVFGIALSAIEEGVSSDSEERELVQSIVRILKVYRTASGDEDINIDMRESE